MPAAVSVAAALSAGTRARFLDLLAEHEREVLDLAIRWVYREATDLHDRHPDDGTEHLARHMLSAYRKFFEADDYEPLENLIAQVADRGPDMLLRLSTPERGFLAFKKAVMPILARSGFGSDETLEILEALDAVYERILFDLSDAYQEKLTKRKEKMSRSLWSLAQRTEAASRAKFEFLANMGHDLREPLNAIVGFSDLLTTVGGAELPLEERNQFLGNIRSSTRALTTLIDDILDMVNLEAGRIKVTEGALDLPKLMQSIYDHNLGHARSKHIAFTLEVAPDVPRYVRSDGQKLNQVLMALITRAVSVTPERRSVHVRTRRGANDRLWFEVEDEGPGVPKELQQRLFEPFHGIEGAPADGQNRLGLAIAARLLEMFRGTIDLNSEIGRGSIFTVTIPWVEARELAGVDEILGISPSGPVFSAARTVLVVDDDATSGELMRAVLLQLGLRVELALGGHEAVELARRVRPDLILMDLHMPRGGGRSAIHAIRSDSTLERTPIIVITGDSSVAESTDWKNLRIDGHILKPVQLEELQTLVARILRI